MNDAIVNRSEQVVREAIYNRRSIRSYVVGKQVEDEKIIKLLEAGMAAPSACNLQPWEFIVVTEKDMMDKLTSTITQGACNPPMAMVICGNTANIPWEGEDWKIDCSAAVENMMIMATTLGLGSLWIGSSDREQVREILDIPDNIGVMSVVYFGYPNESKKSKTRYNESAVFWQKYDPKRVRQMRTMEMLGDACTCE